MAKKLKPLNDYVLITLPVFILFLVMGLLFFCIGVTQHLDYIKLIQNGDKVQGTISSVVTTGSGKHRKTKVYVTFTANDNIRRTFKSSYSAYGMKRGQPIAVVYDPYNPSKADINTKGHHAILAVLETIGLLFVVVPAIFYFRARKKKRAYENLKFLGMPSDERVREVIDGGIRINKRPTYRIILEKEYLDMGPYRGPLMVFNPEPYINGKTVRLVIDASNPESYFMDLAPIEEEYKNTKGGVFSFGGLFGKNKRGY